MLKENDECYKHIVPKKSWGSIINILMTIITVSINNIHQNKHINHVSYKNQQLCRDLVIHESISVSVCGAVDTD